MQRQPHAQRHAAARPFYLAVAATLLAGHATLAEPDSTVLGGPEVEQRDVPGVQQQFGQSTMRQRGGEDRIPLRALRDAVGSLTGDDTLAELRISAEQEETIRAMVTDFQQQRRGFMQEHRDELRELRQSIRRPGDQRQPRDEMSTEGTTPSPQAVRQQIRQIMQQGPQESDLITKIWAELSEEQQDAVETKLDEIRAEMAQQREDQYVERRMRQREGADPRTDKPERDRGRRSNAGPDRARAGTERPGPGPRNTGISPERRERLMRIFERLTPEQQDMVLERLERRLAEQGMDGPPPRRGRGPEADRRERRADAPPPERD